MENLGLEDVNKYFGRFQEVFFLTYSYFKDFSRECPLTKNKMGFQKRDNFLEPTYGPYYFPFWDP